MSNSNCTLTSLNTPILSQIWQILHNIYIPFNKFGKRCLSSLSKPRNFLAAIAGGFRRWHLEVMKVSNTVRLPRNEIQDNDLAVGLSK